MNVKVLDVILVVVRLVMVFLRMNMEELLESVFSNVLVMNMVRFVRISIFVGIGL